MEWGPLCQASETPDKFGVELSMGTALKKINPDREIALIKHALSGSNLYNQWAPGKNKNDTENFGPEFIKFIHTVENGLKELEAKGFEPKIKAMVWQQGEGDARDIAGDGKFHKLWYKFKPFYKKNTKAVECTENVVCLWLCNSSAAGKIYRSGRSS
jgi:hypothetical protein